MVLALTYRGTDVSASTSGSVFDQFVQTADTTSQSLAHNNPGSDGISQSWQSDSSPLELSGVTLRLRRTGSAYGTVRAGIKAHSGTYGTSSVPTGAFLVVSEPFAVDSVSTSPTNYFFPLSGWTPTASTSYVVTLEQRDVLTATGAHLLAAIVETGAEATHGGNSALLNDNVWASNAQDAAFAVYETGGDSTPPTLSSPTGTATSSTTASGTVSTDESNGTLYWVITQSVTGPSVAQVQAGQDELGAAADAFGSQSVTTTGVQNVANGDLAASTTYYWHYQHQDAATNDSTVVSSASFTTDAAGGDDDLLRLRDGTYRRRASGTL